MTVGADAAAVRSATSVATPKSSNFNTIYDIDATESRPFIAMELLEGESLRSRLQGRPVETPAILDIVGQLADALEAVRSWTSAQQMARTA